MDKQKVKVVGPKINATEEIDVSDFKLNEKFDSRWNEVVLDKRYLAPKSSFGEHEEWDYKESMLEIVKTSKHYAIEKRYFPYVALPIVNMLIPDIFNHNNGEPIHCNACVRYLDVYQAKYESKYCYVRFKLTILDYTDSKLKNDIDTIQIVDEACFSNGGTILPSFSYDDDDE